MAFPLESVVRTRNIRFFFLLISSPKIVTAAEEAGIAYQHATRLVRKWRNADLIARAYTLHGMRYLPTEKGKRFRSMLFALNHELEEG